MSRLSRVEVLRHKKLGHIIIEPFNDQDLHTVSYDVKLGEWFFRANQKFNSVYFNPWNTPDDTEWSQNLWETTPLEADLASKVLSKADRKANGVKANDRIIILDPLETVLGHTVEFIGGRVCVTSDMSARSSAGRSNILVCKCAGYGDVGFYNRWTMEITNISKNRLLVLTVGRRIAQISFEEVAPIDESYESSGKYQRHKSLEDLIGGWQPEMMLPKMYLDYEVSDKK